MFDVGGGELLLIVLAILLLFGPDKLPEFAKNINKGLRKIKQAQAQFQSQINDLQKDIDKTINEPESNPSSVPANQPVSKNKIGAFDQLNQENNFVVTDPYQETESETNSETDPDNSTATEKV